MRSSVGVPNVGVITPTGATLGNPKLSFNDSKAGILSRIWRAISAALDFIKSIFTSLWFFCSNKVNPEGYSLYDRYVNSKLSSDEIEALSDKDFEKLATELLIAKTKARGECSSEVPSSPSPLDEQTQLDKVIKLTSNRISKMSQDFIGNFWETNGTALLQMCIDLATHLRDSAENKNGSIYRAKNPQMINNFFSENPEIVANAVLDSIIEYYNIHKKIDSYVPILEIIENNLEKQVKP